MKIAAIIQARLKSTRLPNKCMLEIEGRPMLGHIIDRVRKAIPEIIIATPDAEIAFFAITEGCLAFVGSENDVLDRYYQTAKHYKVENIVRVTSDNPLIDPDVIQKVVDYYYSGDFDYVSNWLKKTYPVGCDLEIFSFKTLETAWKESTETYQREHVTPYIYRHPQKFKLGNVESGRNLWHLRWTVDTQEDLDFARSIYHKLGSNFRMNDVLREGIKV